MQGFLCVATESRSYLKIKHCWRAPWFRFLAAESAVGSSIPPKGLLDRDWTQPSIGSFAALQSGDGDGTHLEVAHRQLTPAREVEIGESNSSGVVDPFQFYLVGL